MIMSELFRIAIDGPSGSGKSTIAKLIADKLKMTYVDTGAMYRAIAYKLKQEIPYITDINLNTIKGKEEYRLIEKIIKDTDIDMSEGCIRIDNVTVGDEIRTPEISMLASGISKLSIIREFLGEIQRRIAAGSNVVMDGRDIGTNIIKDAELKIYLTASPEVRAMRRVRQLSEQGKSIEYEETLKDIIYRDNQDQTRELNPLMKAKDAVIIDTSDMDIGEVVNLIIEKASERNKKA